MDTTNTEQTQNSEQIGQKVNKWTQNTVQQTHNIEQRTQNTEQNE